MRAPFRSVHSVSLYLCLRPATDRLNFYLRNPLVIIETTTWWYILICVYRYAKIRNSRKFVTSFLVNTATNYEQPFPPTIHISKFRKNCPVLPVMQPHLLYQSPSTLGCGRSSTCCSTRWPSSIYFCIKVLLLMYHVCFQISVTHFFGGHLSTKEALPCDSRYSVPKFLCDLFTSNFWHRLVLLVWLLTGSYVGTWALMLIHQIAM